MRLIAHCALPKEVRSLNVFRGRHWASSGTTREKKEWLFWLRSTNGLGVPQEHGGRKRRVEIVRRMGPGQREYDAENLLGGSVKSLCDGLKTLKWLKDDSPKWRDLEVRQERGPAAGCEVAIYELEES